ncbi:hypothetical protein [Leptospira noguchii]|uniref:hypothetical protein n=1 Tax=Leptospira noguchii TaxID=28182 RepID=UPI0018DEED1C|nr:hypothetical protein [Leptospira noguchii]
MRVRRKKIGANNKLRCNDSLRVVVAARKFHSGLAHDLSSANRSETLSFKRFPELNASLPKGRSAGSR